MKFILNAVVMETRSETHLATITPPTPVLPTRFGGCGMLPTRDADIGRGRRAVHPIDLERDA